MIGVTHLNLEKKEDDVIVDGWRRRADETFAKVEETELNLNDEVEEEE